MDNQWVRPLAYVTGLVNQELLLQNEYLVAGNRILKAHRICRIIPPLHKTGRGFVQAGFLTSEGTSKIICEMLDRFNGVDIVIRNVVRA